MSAARVAGALKVVRAVRGADGAVHALSAADPRFSIRVRASKHEPDGFYVNRCLKYVEKQLFE